MSSDEGEIRRADDIGKGEGKKISGRQIGAIAIGAVVVLFALLNTEEANIDLLFGDVSMPLFLVILVFSALGFGAGFLVARHRANKDD